jgi:hypothetical protein
MTAQWSYRSLPFALLPPQVNMILNGSKISTYSEYVLFWQIPALVRRLLVQRMLVQLLAAIVITKWMQRMLPPSVPFLQRCPHLTSASCYMVLITTGLPLARQCPAG